MRHEERAMARRQLDKRLKNLGNLDTLQRPKRGWMRAIREALGMTAAQMAGRMGISQPSVTELEKNEAAGSITLASLERAARALDCQMVYVLVPRRPLEAMVEERAMKLAAERLKRAGHSMTLENQKVDHEDMQAQMEAEARRLVETAGSRLWEMQ